jgi:hypothetical protein
MMGWSVANNQFNKIGGERLSFTYMFPYALISGLMVPRQDDVGIFIIIVPSPGITAELVDLLMGQRPSLQNVYNDVISAAYEVEAFEMFAPLMEDENFDYACLGPAIMYYAVLIPGMKKLMLNCDDVFLNLVTKNQTRWSSEQLMQYKTIQIRDPIEYLRSRLSNPTLKAAIGYIPMKQAIHDVVLYICAVKDKQSKKTLWTIAMLEIPTMSMSTIKEHLTGCHNITTTALFDVDKLADIVIIKPNVICKLKHTKLPQKITNMEVIKTTNDTVVTFEVNNTIVELYPNDDIRLHQIIVKSKTEIVTNAFPNSGCHHVIEILLNRDTTDRLQDVKVNWATKLKDMRIITKKLSYPLNFTKTMSIIMDEVLKYNTVVLLMSDKLPSAFKTAKSKEKYQPMLAPEAIKIYAPDAIVFSLMRDTIGLIHVSQQQNVKKLEVDFEEYDILEDRKQIVEKATHISSATNVFKRIHNVWKRITKMTSTTKSSENTPQTVLESFKQGLNAVTAETGLGLTHMFVILSVMIILIVFWPYVKWLLFFPILGMNAMFAKPVPGILGYFSKEMVPWTAKATGAVLNALYLFVAAAVMASVTTKEKKPVEEGKV